MTDDLPLDPRMFRSVRLKVDADGFCAGSTGAIVDVFGYGESFHVDFGDDWGLIRGEDLEWL